MVKINDIKIGRIFTLKNVRKEPNEFLKSFPVYTFTLYMGKVKIIENKKIIAESIEELKKSVLNDIINSLKKHYK